MTVSKRARFEVLRRDNYMCRYCRSRDNPLTIDHVTPVALGGSDDPSNLVACCRDCNIGKSSSPPDAERVADVEADAMRWAAAMEKAAAVLADQVEEKDTYVAAFLEAWPRHRHMPDSMISTVERFFDLGLPTAVMVDAAATAALQRGIYDRSAYFAGMCWKRLDAMRDIASQIVREDE